MSKSVERDRIMQPKVPKIELVTAIYLKILNGAIRLNAAIVNPGRKIKVYRLRFEALN